MESSELIKAWEQASQLLRLQLSDISYNSWIKPITPAQMTDDSVVFTLEKDFQLTHVRQRYHIMISNAMEQVLGHPVRCTFVLPSELKERKRIQGNILLNPKYTFDSFVVGSSNRFAQAAAMAVANSIGTAYNPLFIYGGVGLGKTHLMHAIGNHIMKVKPETKLLYVTSEAFTNELITAIQTKRNMEFRERYRNLDILLIDDIQFIVGRESTQEEIFHTFNALYQANKQIVLSSDKHPKDIAMLEERLVSRFESGLVADVQKPDFETTVAILRKKAEGYRVPEDVLQLIAQYVFSSVREIEGCLNRIVAKAAVLECPIDCDLARSVLGDLRTVKDPRRITPDAVMETVAQFYGISILDLKSQKRSREIAVPRQIAMYLMRDLLSLSLSRIGSEFSGRDHTTVMHACDKIAAEMKNDFALKQDIEDIKKKINHI